MNFSNISSSIFRGFRSYLRPQIIIILFLGLSSGLPLALILSTLKALLVDMEVDIATIGFFSLALIPYSLKFLWAPLMDSIPIPYLKRLGKRRSWILLSQLLLITFIAALGFFGGQGNLFYLTIFAFLISFTSASQDIVVDAYRIESVKEENQAIAASMYVYGYRIGLLISGAGALILSDMVSWDKVYYVMALSMFIGVITTLVAGETFDLKETSANEHVLSCGNLYKYKNFVVWLKSSVVAPLEDFMQRPKWYVIFAFIILFKLGDAFAGTLTLPFLLDIDFTKTQIATIVKTFGLFATILGAFLGGILVKNNGIVKSLWIAGIMQMASNLAFYYQSFVGNDPMVLYFVIFIENFSGGIGDVVFIAYLSSLCNISFTATQYSILVSLATTGRSVLSSSTGIFAGYLGWGNFFLLSTIVALPGLVLLYFLTQKKN